MATERTATILPYTRQRTGRVRRNGEVQFVWGRLETVPELRLRGRWLHDHGFLTGARVRIRASQGRLVITIERKEVSA